VVWDLDGTLADTEQAHFRAWQTLCREHGRSLTWEEFKPTFGLGNQDILHMLIAPSLDADEVEALSRHKEELFREETGGLIAFMPGAQELVEHLQALDIPQAIGSSAPPENIVFMLRALGLEQTFPVTVSRWQVARGKPFPDIFLRAVSELGLEPHSCVVLEDAPAGIQAAHAGGMRCIVLASTWPETALSGADLIVRNFNEVLWPLDQWQSFVAGVPRPTP
jgi:HAD superfamily hydrolase (TIGR01509 family)